MISNVASGELCFSNTRYVSKEYYDSLSPFRKAKAGDLLFTVTGSYGIPIPVNTNTPFCFQRHIAIIRPCIIDHQYLAATLGSMYIKKLCDEKATGIAQKTVDLSTLRRFLLPVAPTSEQERILAVISTALETFSKAKLSADALKENVLGVKAKILDLAIRGKLVPQDPADEPASVLLERIRADKEEQIKAGKIKRDKKESFIFRGVDNSYYEIVDSRKICLDKDLPFEIPQNWQWVRLGTLFQHNTGKALNSSDNNGERLEYITTSNVYWNRFELQELKRMPFSEIELEKCSIRRGDLLVCEGGDIGRAAIWEYDEPMMIQNHIHRLRPYIEVSPLFYLYVLYRYKQIGLIGGNGIGIQGLSSNAIHQLIIPLPPLAEQKRIISAVHSLFAPIERIQNAL